MIEGRIARTADWSLRVAGHELSSDAYHGSFEIVLQDQLRRPSYKLAIDRVQPALHDELIVDLRHRKNRDATLTFGWRGQASVVAELWITDVQLEPAQLFYVLTVQATSAAHHRLSMTPAELNEDIWLDEAIRELAQKAGVESRLSFDNPPRDAKRDKAVPHPEETCLTALRRIGRRLEDRTRQYGRGMALLSGETLHAGPDRVSLDAPLTLTSPTDGLVHASPQIDSSLDEKNDRGVWSATLLGRPDIAPGAIVELPVPGRPERLPMYGAVAAGAQLLRSFAQPAAEETVLVYVQGLTHVIGRERGFTTRIVGVEVRSGDIWDSSDEQGVRPRSRTRGPTAAQSAVNELFDVLERKAVRAFVGLGEITRFLRKNQLVSVARGLEASKGENLEVRRLKTHERAPRTEGVAYATPFAWGLYGLVLPRYPGMRVLLLEHGEHKEPVDVGSLWREDVASDARDGDYWLSLPVDVPAKDRESSRSLNDDPFAGKASNDLIDGSGNRAMEARAIAIVAGNEALRDAGERPPMLDEDAQTSPLRKHALRLAHAKSGSEIVLHENGNIEIKAKGDLVLDAKNVRVQVEGTMDVRERGA